MHPNVHWSFPGGAMGKNLPAKHRRRNRSAFDPWVGKSPWSRKWQCTPIFLPGKSHSQSSLVGYSPWGHPVGTHTMFTAALFIIIAKTVSHSVISDSVTPWTLALQAPLSMEFSRQECWGGLPFPSSGDLPPTRGQTQVSTLQADSLPSEWCILGTLYYLI